MEERDLNPPKASFRSGGRGAKRGHDTLNFSKILILLYFW